jgi:hypothetical protein
LRLVLQSLHTGSKETTVNVTIEANAAFMRALEIEDPKRYAELMKQMRREAAKYSARKEK